VLERLGRVDEAAAQHGLAVGDPHAFAGTWFERGMFRLRGGDRDGAIEDLTRAARLDPAWPAPRARLRELGAPPR
jgi:Tfp pilus assembly protein PilF